MIRAAWVLAGRSKKVAWRKKNVRGAKAKGAGGGEESVELRVMMNGRRDGGY